MSVTTEQSPSRQRVARSPRSRGRAKPVGGSTFEVFSWYFFRISGLVLIFLAIFHLTWQNLVIGVDRIDYNYVALQWSNPFWRIADWLLLMLATLHGMNGLRVVVDDYVHSPGWRLTVNSALAIITFFLVAIGSITVFTFQPGVR